MRKFCTKCGSKLDDVTGKCPVCDKELTKKEVRKQKKEEKKEAKRTAKKEKWKKLSFKQKVKKICLRFVLIILVLLLLLGSGTATLVYFDVVDIPIINEIFDFIGIKEIEQMKDTSSNKEGNVSEENDTTSNTQYSVDHPDADKYFKDNSKILSEINVDKSDKVLSEVDVYNLLNERGFVDYPIVTEYSMDGEYNKTENISQSSSTKHPMYQTTYISSSGEMWTIILINDAIMANPVSYNMQSGRKVQVVLSEKDSVISYDSAKNKFYETIPNESELIVKKIEKIDVETLEKMNVGAIDEL